MDQFQQVMAQFVGISETNNFCFRSFSLKSIFQPLKQLISIFWTLLRRGQRTYCNHYVIAQKWSKLLRYNERISFHVTGIIKWLFCLKKNYIYQKLLRRGHKIGEIHHDFGRLAFIYFKRYHCHFFSGHWAICLVKTDWCSMLF